MEHVLEIKDLAIGYKDTVVASDINLTVKPGEFLAVLGPNGCGKSTLLRTIAGLEKPLGGSIRLCGQDIRGIDENKRARLMSALFTNPVVVKGITVYRVVAMGRYPYTGLFGIPGREDEEVIERSMEMAGVKELAEREMECLSDGQRQRVHIAAALCQEPSLMLLDEPTSHLDIRYRLDIMTILKKLTQEKKTAVVCCVHDPLLAMSLCDRRFCIKDGKEFDGGMMELYDIDKGDYPEGLDRVLDGYRM